ncbi:hypothetical protein [Neomoorella thermoacetica]|uniref:hypothetical protein n=1 Tax=Neomoorella thermoacetica TaxID=1525 RepID=UPI0008FB2DF9|nr:hypothetical protein [Moorella thermoacetica]APC08568.1 hypothetical protein MTJW_14090 [Moorella thermoacetica]
MKQVKSFIPKDNLQLEVPDQVYRRLVKMLIQSVMQEGKPGASNKLYKSEKGVKEGALRA